MATVIVHTFHCHHVHVTSCTKRPQDFARCSIGQPRCLLTLLLRQTTGHIDMPRVQQQQRQPQSNQRTLTGIVLLSTLLTLVTVALYSSGATCAQDTKINFLVTRRLVCLLWRMKKDILKRGSDPPLIFTNLRWLWTPQFFVFFWLCKKLYPNMLITVP